MQIKNIANWNYTPQMEGLLFFANIIDEMTFNYTLDSFKASVHNVFSLISECIETINDIQDETIRKGALPPILEEINDAIIHDHFFNIVLQSKGYDLLVPKIIANTPNKELKLILEMLLSKEVFEQYNDCLKAELSDLIKTKPNHKKNIEKYSRLFVAQMRFMGYPNASVYMKNKDFFFGNASNIQSVNDIDAFFSLFDFKRQEYSVCLFGNKLYSYLSNALQQVQISITNTFNLSSWNSAYSNISITRNKGQYIIIDIEAMDEYHAFERAKAKLVHFTSLFSFYHHKDQFKLIRNESVVRRKSDGACFRWAIPESSIMACEDTYPTFASNIYQQAINRIQLDGDSFERFTKTIRLHDSAIRSSHTENQFLNLFTAFEVLIPKVPDSGKDRIVQIADIIIPYLCQHHFKKIAVSFGQDFRHWNKVLYTNIMAQITDGNTEEEKLCALIGLQKYDPQRSQIIADASAAHFYLLRYRLWKLNIRMGSVKNVKATFTRFEERMRWHITRLYRTRNLIVHAGAHPVYLDMLLENIHSFYDMFMRELLTDITVHNALKLEYSYILHEQRYMEYKQYLEELDNGVAVNANNYLKVLGIV
jgi:hypothetical protein